MAAKKSDTPSMEDTLGQIVGALGAINERLSAVESGVTVEADEPKPAAKRGGGSTTAKKGKPNRFTPYAVASQAIPTEVGEEFGYEAKNGNISQWVVVGVGPCKLDGAEAEEGAILARRA